jgi:threonine/homoserine/homoserine lactone efflux protein
VTAGLAAAIPLALGAAVSPTVLIANLLVLSSVERSRARGLAFAVGAFVVLIGIGALSLTVLHAASQNRGKGTSFFGWVDVFFALLLAGFAVHGMLSAPKPKPANDRSSRLAHAPTYDYLIFGVVTMATNVTTIMLFIPAMNDIAAADAGFTAKAATALAVLLITTIVVWVPLALDLAAPHTAGRVLGGLSRFLSVHQRVVGIVVAFAFATYLTVKGVREL